MAWIQGTDDRDVLVGANDPDTILGRGGNDDLFGGDGDDSLSGGDGDDYLYGGSGADLLDGGAGIDLARYDAALSAIIADLLLLHRNTGEALGDSYAAIEGLVGGGFADELRGDDGRNIIFGLDGDDLILGRDGDDDLIGGAGRDSFYGEAGNDHIYPGGDSDYFVNVHGAHLIDGGDGFDFVHYEELGQRIQIDLRVTMFGYDTFVDIEGLVATQFNDSISGTDGANWLYGLAGTDYLAGQGGDDYLLGGSGNDSLDGGHGDDWLYGEDGNDILIGGSGDDVLLGEGGDDRLWHDSGRDILHGGDGDDLLFAMMHAEGHYYGGAGVDTIDYGQFGVPAEVTIIDLLLPGVGATANHHYDSIERVLGTGYNDSVRGTAAANSLLTGAGDDILYGRGGDDFLNGGAGSDVLFGNAGDDVLLGDDVRFPGVSDYDGFYFGVGDGNDTIQDFQAGAGLTDTLYLSTELGVSSFTEVMSKAAQTDAGVLLTFSPGETILLNWVAIGSLVADDFGFY